MLTVSYLSAFFAGLISFLSPCVLPLIPPYLSFITGKSLQDLTDGIDHNKRILSQLIWRALAFIGGFTTVFVILGASATLLGQAVESYFEILSRIAGIIIIIMGIHFLGIIKIPFLMMEKRYYSGDKPQGFWGSYLIGLAFAFGWTPCIGPILATILTIAAVEQSAYTGMALLAVYSAGLGVPFLLAAIFLKPFIGFMNKFRKHLGTVEKVMGIFLILSGIMFLTGYMGVFAFWLLETFPFFQNIG